MDIKQLRSLAKIMEDTGLSVLEVTEGDLNIHFERPTAGFAPMILPAAAPASASAAPAAAPAVLPKRLLPSRWTLTTLLRSNPHGGRVLRFSLSGRRALCEGGKPGKEG